MNNRVIQVNGLEIDLQKNCLLQSACKAILYKWNSENIPVLVKLVLLNGCNFGTFGNDN